ncbi:hypothetical protein NP493_1373g00018 [Ridgeia piscesae]|uniref:Phenylalanine ammonia-lyase n=1 Tax=Ridgeia piscesae TaxID=27915 RepID=A0AAD9K674_RIDPI|nr:hypothetical protein NP493_1373g00018 [Ridgeia piscesae]
MSTNVLCPDCSPGPCVSGAAAAISSLEEYKYKQADDCVVLNGRGLTIATIYAVASRRSTKVAIEPRSVDKTQENVDYLSGKIQDGMVIYGVNTGYGGIGCTTSIFSVFEWEVTPLANETNSHNRTRTRFECLALKRVTSVTK